MCERFVGVSNWTNIECTWGGLLMKVREKSHLGLSSTSVVATPATSLDKYGAGRTFHLAVASIKTRVPHATLTPFMLFVRCHCDKPARDRRN